MSAKRKPKPAPRCVECDRGVADNQTHYRLADERWRLDADGFRSLGERWSERLCARCSLLFELTKIERFDNRLDAPSGRLHCGGCDASIQPGATYDTLTISRQDAGRPAEPVFQADACGECMRLYDAIGLSFTPSPALRYRCHACRQLLRGEEVVVTQAIDQTPPWDPLGELGRGEIFLCMECVICESSTADDE
ncbi:hypothetical protein [Adhaeretor mobilis]|uniref:Uncharacterized protein n=1 Tax=Adhaeretor mobilis TaxID=1930276 RepID=A0A517MQJ0_9BACT|nr:hypothetical protein [Adhaeretor mobilis]QDS97047.1 hypothetical protein HG15A2_03060 [Adhaeretor mobilis]